MGGIFGGYFRRSMIWPQEGNHHLTAAPEPPSLLWKKVKPRFFKQLQCCASDSLTVYVFKVLQLLCKCKCHLQLECPTSLVIANKNPCHSTRVTTSTADLCIGTVEVWRHIIGRLKIQFEGGERWASVGPACFNHLSFGRDCTVKFTIFIWCQVCTFHWGQCLSVETFLIPSVVLL